MTARVGVMLAAAAAFMLGIGVRHTAAQTTGRMPTAPDDVRTAFAAGKAAAASEDWAQAAARFQEVLNYPEDYFGADGEPAGLKARVDALLAAMPAAGRDAYERLYGTQARGLYDEASQAGDVGALRAVVRQYFYTEAGRDAAIDLAERHADGGDMLAAARLYDRLAGHPALGSSQRPAILLRSAVAWWIVGTGEAAQVRLAERARLAPGADAQTSVPAGMDQALEWLSTTLPQDAAPDATTYHVTVFRGNPSRNSATSPAVPVGDIQWSHPVIDEFDSAFPEFSTRIEDVQQRLIALERRLSDPDADEHMLLPAGIPLIANGIVVVHGPGTVKAFSLSTGELLWPSAHIDETFHHFVDGRWEPEEEWHKANLDLFLAQRTWRDLSAASLSTDGAYVYAVFDGGMISSMSQAALNLPDLATHPLAPHPYNRLVAIELVHGRLKWSAGGPSGPFPDELAGVYFLGAPLPLDGELYCLVEDRGQVRLLVLDAAKAAADPQHPANAVVWSQPLYNPDVNLSNAWLGTERRMAGLTPTAAGDVVVCPTGESTVVAVDRTTRSLLWTREYREPAASSPHQALAIRMMLARQQQRGRMEDQLIEELLQPDHWADCAPVITGQSVLLTPPDANDLVCLDLLDGTERWRQPRGDRLFIAGVHGNNVILVGMRQVEALQLATGEPGWESAVPISRPAGRGFRHGRFYVLPLASGGIVTIDLDRARIAASSQIDFPEGPGNLVASDGRVACQTATGIRVFPALDELRQASEGSLVANPDDAAALALRGEVRLHLGDENAGLEDLRTALSLRDDPHARDVLVGALMEGLRTDFNAYRDQVDEIERYVSDPQQQRRFRRLYAQGLQDAGETVAAFREYLQFAAVIPEIPELERIAPDWSVREDRWSRGRLAAIWESSDAGQRDTLRRVLDESISEVLGSDDDVRMAGLLAVIPDRDAADRLRLQWCRQASAANQFRLLELQLLTLLESDVSEHQAEAAARLADLWLSRGEPAVMLREILDQLQGSLANTVCLDGKTGTELLADWRADAARAVLMDPAPVWPTGHVTADPDGRVTTAGQLFAVPSLGRPSEVLRGWTFFTDANGTNLLAFDEQGQRKWHIPSGSQNRRGRSNDFVRYVMTFGRLVLVAVEDQFTIVDALAGGQAVEVLANERLTPDADQSPFIVNMQRGNGGVRLRNRVWMDPQNGTSAIGNIGPLNGDTFVYQSGQTLRAISPHDGRPLWTREVPGLNPGGDILSDEEYTVVWPASGSQFRLFRTADGESLGDRTIPASAVRPQPDGHWGRLVVCLERSASGEDASLGLYDPAREQFVWQRPLTDLADWSVVDGGDFSVLSRDGTLRVVSGATGEDRLTLSLSTEPLPERAIVIADPKRYYVMTYAAPEGSARVVDTSQPQFPQVHGIVTACDRSTGERLWSRPIAHQQLQADTPGGWPVLVFAAQVIDPNPGENGRAGGRFWSMKVLDKESGAVMFETEVNGRLDKRGWESNPERHELAIAAGSARVLLRFSDAAPDQGPEPESP